MANPISTMPPAFGSATLRDYPWWVLLVEGIAAVVLGVFMFMNPVATTETIVLVIAVYWIISGIVSLVSLLWDRSQWGWRLVWGVISVAAGWFIVTDLTVGALTLLWVYVIILGVQGIFLGIAQLVSAAKGGGWGRGALGALSLLIGVLLLSRSYIAAFALPLVFGALGILFGAVAIVGSFVLRKAQNAPLDASGHVAASA